MVPEGETTTEDDEGVSRWKEERAAGSAVGGNGRLSSKAEWREAESMAGHRTGELGESIYCPGAYVSPKIGNLCVHAHCIIRHRYSPFITAPRDTLHVAAPTAPSTPVQREEHAPRRTIPAHIQRTGLQTVVRKRPVSSGIPEWRLHVRSHPHPVINWAQLTRALCSAIPGCECSTRASCCDNVWKTVYSDCR